MNTLKTILNKTVGTYNDSYNPFEEGVNWKKYIYHFGYYICHWIKSFFKSPYKETPDLDILEIARSLLVDFDDKHDDANIDKSEKLIALHRTVENTRARRRLEKWSLKVIALYLLAVLCIVVLTYCEISNVCLPKLAIPDNVMIAILTTTTANIIGLGLIVLRGHFLASDIPAKKKTEKDS